MSDFDASRRQVLAGGAAVAVAVTAGCLDAVRESADEDDESTLELTLFPEDGPLREAFVVDLERTRPEWDEAAFAAVLDGETYTRQGTKPFLSTPDDPAYAEREGTYYRLDSVVVDEVETVYPVLRLVEVEASESTDSVAASSLPEPDRRAVEIAHLAARARGDEGGVPWGLVRRGGYVYRRDEAAESSELLSADGPERVTFRETTYAVDVTRETFYEPVYRARAEPVASTPERMETILRAKFVEARFGREDISADARDVVEAARGDGHRETHPYSEGFRSVLRRLHERAYIDGDVRKDAGVTDDGRRMVLYDGVYYDYRLRFVTA